jgi:hypothetical protein
MERTDELEVVNLARRQHGLITSSQLRTLAMPKDLAAARCRSGAWESLGRGLFLVGAAPQTFHQRCMAAHLRAGPDSLVSHRTAARLWGVGANGAVPIEVSIPRGRRHSAAGVISHTSGDLDLASSTTVHGLPVTGLARSLLDLGAVEPARVRRAVWAARREHGLGWDDLLTTLVRHAQRGRSGVGPLRRVLAVHYGEQGGDSATEDIAYAILVDSGLVPIPMRQYPVVCADGVTVTVDFAWPNRRALLEIVGVDHFTNEDLQHIDLHRRNQIELAGWSLLVHGGRNLRTRPDQLVIDCVRLLELEPPRPPHAFS